jgi:hypothetical protein
MAISAYELLECVANMTNGQRNELYKKLWGSAEVELTTMSEEMRRLNLHGHALDTIRGLEFLEDHQWRDLLSAMKAGLSRAEDLATVLSGMLAEANLSLVRTTPPASGTDLVPIRETLPGATRSHRQPTGTRDMGYAVALLAAGEGKRGGPHDLRAALAQAQQHLLAAKHTGNVITSFPLEYMTHAEYVRDRVRGMTDVEAAGFIATYLRPLLQDNPATPNTLDQICAVDTALNQICADPVIFEVVTATRDPRALRAMVLDLLFKDDRPGIHQATTNILRDDRPELPKLKGNISWDSPAASYQIENCVILGAGEAQIDAWTTVACEQAIAEGCPTNVRVRPADWLKGTGLLAGCIHLTARAEFYDLLHPDRTDVKQIKVDFDTDLSLLHINPQDRWDYHLVLHNAFVLQADWEKFLASQGTPITAPGQDLILTQDQSETRLVLRQGTLISVGQSVVNGGLVHLGELHLMGTAIRREPPAHDDQGRTKSILDMSPIRPPVDLPVHARSAPAEPDSPVAANDLFDAAIAVSWWLDDVKNRDVAVPLRQLHLLLDAGFELLSLRQQILALEGLQPDEQVRAIQLISGDIQGALEKITDPERLQDQMRALAQIVGDKSTNLKAVGLDFKVEQEALQKEDEARRKADRMGGNPFDRDWNG